MKSFFTPIILTALTSLFAIQVIAQCGNSGNNLQNFTVLSSQESVSSSIIDEISGMTYNDETGELYVVSDDGKLARRTINGVWQDIDVNDWSGNTCRTNKFGDIEGITYMGSVGGNTYRYAIAEERERFITFVNISTSQTSLDFPDNSFLKFSGISFTSPNCGANDGIEGIAYDQNTNTMFFSKERNDQDIYSFTVPSNINGQTITPRKVVDLATIPNLDTYAIHGMDVLSNGNIMALVAKNGPSGIDAGLYERMILEFDTCGNLLSQVDLEPTINDSAELEGIASMENSICVIGEFGVMYHLDTPPIASASPDLTIVSVGTLNQVNTIISNTNVRVRNQGTDDATNYSIGAYLSTDSNVTFSDIRIGSAMAYSSHTANEDKFFNFTFDCSSINLSPGVYYLGYIVDEFDDQSESNESNNIIVLSSQMVTISNTCPITIDLDYTPVPNGLYETSVSIYSAGNVNQFTQVEYSAGQFIELESGFEVKSNASFEARIDGCI